jgi:hypothetical protein
MRIASHAPELYVSGQWYAQVPTSVVVHDAPLGGTDIETLAPHADGQGGYYADTTDALYASATEYWADWHSTILGVDRVGTLPFWMQISALGTPPGPASISLISRTATTVTLAHTPPTDVSYATTSFLAVCVDGGATVLASSSLSTVTLSGLSPSRTDIIVATAMSNTGLPSILTEDSIVWVRTLDEDPPTLYAMVNFFSNDEQDANERGPWFFDPDAEAGMVHEILQPGRFRIGRLRIDAPCPYQNYSIRGEGFHYTTEAPNTGEPADG